MNLLRKLFRKGKGTIGYDLDPQTGKAISPRRCLMELEDGSTWERMSDDWVPGKRNEMLYVPGEPGRKEKWRRIS